MLGINNPFAGSEERAASPSDFNNPFLDDLRAAAAASAVARGDSNPFDVQVEESKFSVCGTRGFILRKSLVLIRIIPGNNLELFTLPCVVSLVTC